MTQEYASAIEVKNGRLFQRIAEYEITSPPIPSKEKFLNGDVKKKRDQKFAYTPIPSPDAWGAMSDEEQTAWEDQEWERREKGIWFYNNGQPTWLTGLHYYFLNYYFIKGVKPEYRDADRAFFWVWDYCANHPKCEGLLYITRRQQGKCLKQGTLVRMFDGTLRPVELIRVGEQVMGVDSTPRTVLHTHSGIDEMYEIVQDRGMAYTVNSQHTISLRRNLSKQGKFTRLDGQERFRDYPEFDQVANIPVLELKERADKFFSSFSGYRTGYEMPEKEVKLDPYFLGAWLGDGNAHRPGITSPDPEIIKMVHDIADSYGLVVTPNQNAKKTCATYMITSGYETGGARNQLLKDFRHYGLFEAKRIPGDYLRNSRRVRMQVLAGLIDTDGHKAQGFYEIVQKGEGLAKDICELAVSLGFRCYMRPVTKGIKSTGFSGTYFRINLCGEIDKIPLRIERKRITLKPNKDKQLTRIKAINHVGKGRYFGFELDGDHLFLLEDGTVTHNSFRGGCIALEYATRTPNKHIGIQSKTEDDAADLFQRAVVESWIKLPAYFSPKFSNSNNMEVKALRFEARATRGKASQLEGGGAYQEAGLNTYVDFADSKPNAYDGDPKMGFFLNDEIFKKQLYDPVKRWSIVRKIFKQSGKVIAKSFHTSSVGEEIEEKGVERAKKLWDASNPTKLLKNGQTSSGLFRLFQPAYVGYMWDEYGMDKTDEAMLEFQAARDGYKENNDHNALLGEKRANPFNVDEALLPEADSGPYNNLILVDTIDKINGYNALTGKQVPYPYKLRWTDDSKTKVEAIPFQEGRNVRDYRFLISYLPDAARLNRVQERGQTVTQYGLQTLYAPRMDSTDFGIAIDPVDHRAVKDDGGASLLSASGFWKFDPMHEMATKGTPEYWPSGSFIFQYAHRIFTEKMYEDMVMACHFFGCKMLFENQKPGIESYFINRGYEAFLEKWEQTKVYGVSASPTTIAKYVEKTDRWIGEGEEDTEPTLAADWRRCPFPSILKQWISFDPNNTKRFDEAVSASYTLMYCLRYIPTPPPAEDIKEIYLDI